MTDSSDHWRTLGSKTLHRSPWIDLIEDEVITPAGNESRYSRVHFHNFGIGILPLAENWDTWIVGQYRYPIGVYTWEIPEGGGPIEVDPLSSAKRELKEEAGIEAERWELIQENYMSDSATDEYAYIYLARDLTIGDPEPEEDELLELRRIPFEELYRMVVNGSVRDSLTVLAVLRARCYLDLPASPSS
jgi:8-oxo-dGTP pyrophosphatase MutT (NUDIX family)